MFFNSIWTRNAVCFAFLGILALGSFYESQAGGHQVTQKKEKKHVSAGLGSRVEGGPVGQGLVISPATSSLQNAVYLLHGFHSPLAVEKLDLGGIPVSPAELWTRTAPFRKLVLELNSAGVFRYSGRVTATEKRPGRSCRERGREHLREILRQQSLSRKNVTTYNLFEDGQTIFMQAAAYNIAPSQIAIIEAYFIRIMGGLGEWGANSTSGGVDRLKEYLGQYWMELLQFEHEMILAEKAESAFEVENQSPDFFPSDFCAREGAQLFGFFSPRKTTHYAEAICLTPASVRAQDSIYLFHDLPEELDFFKVDLRGQRVTEEEFEDRIADLKILARSWVEESGFRYVGKAGTSSSHPDRILADRVSEHANAIGRGEGTRKALGMQKSALLERMLYVQALVINIHPSQLAAVESRLIELFAGNEGTGGNSNLGSRQHRLPSASKRLKYLDPNEDLNEDLNENLK